MSADDFDQMARDEILLGHRLSLLERTKKTFKGPLACGPS